MFNENNTQNLRVSTDWIRKFCVFNRQQPGCCSGRHELAKIATDIVQRAEPVGGSICGKASAMLRHGGLGSPRA